jgi:hypothetical protein
MVILIERRLLGFVLFVRPSCFGLGIEKITDFYTADYFILHFLDIVTFVVAAAVLATVAIGAVTDLDIVTVVAPLV